MPAPRRSDSDGAAPPHAGAPEDPRGPTHVRVSVIVPTYRRPAWCEEAVRSVLEQTGVDAETLVVLDGEQPETAARLAGLAPAAGDRLRVVTVPHGGQSAAQNAGIALARGDLLAFLDDDDRLLPRGLAARVAALDRHPEAVAVFGRPAVMDAGGREVEGSRRAATRGRETCRRRLTEILRGSSVFPSTALVRRDAVARAGGFDADLWTGQDWAFFLRLAAVGPFVSLPEATVLRRRHAGQFRANAAEQEAGIERWATRYFDDPRTPPEAQRHRASLLGLHYHWIARNHRRAGDLASYRRCFRRAVRLRPSLLLHPRRLVRYVGVRLRGAASPSPSPSSSAATGRGVGRAVRSYVRILTRAPLRNLATRRALARWFTRPLKVVADGLDRGPARVCTATTRDGGELTYRAGTADPIVLREVFAADAYRLDRLPAGRLGWIVDVGGHIGLFARRAAAHAEHVLVFEPVPDNFALLSRNLTGPAFAHVERVNAAVSDRAGTLRLFLGGKNTGGHTSFPAHAPEPGTHVDVPCLALADELDARGISRVGLLKLDCEGAEYAILDGLGPDGLARIDRIAMEYHPVPGAAGDPARSGEGLEARLSAAGFSVERVPGKRAGGGLLFAHRVA